MVHWRVVADFLFDQPLLLSSTLMTGSKPGRPGCVVVDGPGPRELWLLQDLNYWTAGAHLRVLGCLGE